MAASATQAADMCGYDDLVTLPAVMWGRQDATRQEVAITAVPPLHPHWTRASKLAPLTA